MFCSIVAASIPALRPLLTKRARHSTKPYSERRQRQPVYRSKSGPKETFIAAVSGVVEDDVPLHLEDYLATSQHVVAANRIRSTTTIEIESVVADDGSYRVPPSISSEGRSIRNDLSWSDSTPGTEPPFTAARIRSGSVLAQ